MRILSLNNVRLRNKLLLLYFLSVFFPILFTNVFFYTVTTHNVRNQKEHDVSLALDKIRNDFRVKIDDAVGISAVFYTDLLIHDALEQQYESPIDYLDTYETDIRPSLNKYSPIYKSIREIAILTDNPTVLGAGGISMITDEVKASGWYREVMASKASYPVIVHSREKGKPDVFSVIRKLNNFTNQNRFTKILKIDLHPDTLKQVFQDGTLQGNLYLVNASNEIEYTTDSTVRWQQEKINFAAFHKPQGALVFEKSYDNVNYLRDWKVIGILPEHQMLEVVRKSRAVVIYLACANILLPTLVIVWITKSLHDRVLRIVRHMKKVKHQTFETIDHVETKDEIGQLTLEYNRMTRQIRTLIDDVYVADIQKKDLELKRRKAQLHALQSQINPHFLFNALETLRMRSLLKQEDETAKIIHNMAKIFRKSLTWGNDWVTVRQEMDLVYSFLEIQKYRFEEKLHYRVEVGEDVAECKIPKMVFLPFVENASIHGIEPIHGQGEIDLRISLNEGEIHFELRDNGAGISEEKLENLLAYIGDEEEMGDHIGIKNVYARLNMYYGENARLTIDSKPGAGTTIRIRIPDQLNFLQ
ncbi:cache domain-containing sensor histidine kinase [Cohnella silvisoli]|uniref:histidine kinase n=1 Tax=Cohnella silvisoli TaxID=2873699 RepID=A0ABV1KX14_9BACL|nr:sensor histidine kinase [Cohnella silvisoli]MCD9023725.1 sensor histidine kinase [Cohnella silvisoli]